MIANVIDQLIREKRLYFVGERLPADWYEAFRLWLPLAESGDAKAQFNIGRCYSLGDGVDKDQSKSIEWLMKAAAQGDPRAHFNLHLHYEEINDKEKAAEWLTKATGLGEPRALMASGKQVLGSGNKDQAKVLFKRAVDLGYEDAKLGLAACDIEFSHFIREGSSISYRLKNNSSAPVFIKARVHECVKGNPEKILGNDLWGPKELVEPGLDIKNRLLQYGGSPGSVAMLGFTLWSVDVDKNIIYNSEQYFPFEKNLQAKGPCFILTACYGDYDAPTVMQYRHFRDNYLDKNIYGRKFIAWYYIHGPKWAEMIEKMPRTKAVFRGFFKLLSYLLPH